MTFKEKDSVHVPLTRSVGIVRAVGTEYVFVLDDSAISTWYPTGDIRLLFRPPEDSPAPPSLAYTTRSLEANRG